MLPADACPAPASVKIERKTAFNVPIAAAPASVRGTADAGDISSQQNLGGEVNSQTSSMDGKRFSKGPCGALGTSTQQELRSSSSRRQSSRLVRRLMPTQGADMRERKSANVAAVPEDEALYVMIDMLWTNHKLLPPSNLSSFKRRWDIGSERLAASCARAPQRQLRVSACEMLHFTARRMHPAHPMQTLHCISAA
eukprot:2555213-Prymnesium_polylepis.1